MKRKYTKNDVLRYIYGEMPPAEHNDFLDAIREDEELFETFEALNAAQEDLSPVELTPSIRSVGAVMSYARHAAGTGRRGHNPFLATGKNKIMNFHHVVSIVMVFFTCITIALAMYAYQKAATPDNTWSLTPTSNDLINHALDQRLDFARERLQNIMDNRRETVVPVHHDTYRVVPTDIATPTSNEVVLVNIK